MEESNRRIDGDHLVIVREVGIEIAIEGEGDRGCIKRLVRLRLISDGLACQPSEQLVDISNTLNRAQRTTMPINSMEIQLNARSERLLTYPVL